MENIKKRKLNKIFGFIAEHRIFSIAIGSFIFLSIINCYLIYSFIRILGTSII